MAALTADKPRVTSGNPVGVTYPVAASTTIFLGSLVNLDASGNAVAGTDAASRSFVGVAAEYIDNSDGSAGDLSICVQTGQLEKLNHSALVAADKGKNVVISDDNTVTDTAAATNDVKVGTLMTISGSTCEVLVGVLAATDA